ncbi:MAG: hypothetical protein IIB17_00615 [Chloroflexi bacterium]|nr:hypothetical protein [Chloroflexota bacterium]
MSELGDLLELLYTARTSFTTVEATINSWTHNGRRAEAMRRWAATKPQGSVASFGRGTRQADVVEHVSRLWLQKPSRLRNEFGQSGEPPRLRVVDGDRWWAYNPNGNVTTNVRVDGTVVPEHSSRMTIDPPIVNQFYDPSSLIPAFDMEPVESAVFAGRTAIRVIALPRDDTEPVMWPGVTEIELLVDADLGVILAATAFLDDEVMARVETTSATFDEPISEDIFTFDAPPGAEVKVIEPTDDFSRGPIRTNRPTNVPKSPPPPDRPPTAYLLLRNDDGVRDRQKAVDSHHDWWVDGKVESSAHNGSWPAPLDISETDQVALRIEGDAAPALTEIRVRRLNADGEPEDTVLLHRCGHDGMFSGHERCGFVRKSIEDGEGWEMPMPLPAAAGSYFIRV